MSKTSMSKPRPVLPGKRKGNGHVLDVCCPSSKRVLSPVTLPVIFPFLSSILFDVSLFLPYSLLGASCNNAGRTFRAIPSVFISRTFLSHFFAPHVSPVPSLLLFPEVWDPQTRRRTRSYAALDRNFLFRLTFSYLPRFPRLPRFPHLRHLPSYPHSFPSI